jgi:hypothetical protein
MLALQPELEPPHLRQEHPATEEILGLPQFFLHQPQPLIYETAEAKKLHSNTLKVIH